MKNFGISGLRWPQLSLLAGFVLAALLVSPSWAQVDYNWAGGAGVQDWGDPNNWTPNGVPGATDTANLVQNDAVDRTAAYRNILPAAPALAGVVVHASGAGAMTLQLSQTGIPGDLVTQNAWIGQGQVNQAAGSFTAYNLILGEDAGQTGTYNLGGGNVNPTYLYVGNYGTGVFHQAELFGIPSNVTVTDGGLSLGTNAGATGTYNLIGGTLTTPWTNVGDNGAGTFNQGGGDHNVDNYLTVGANPGSTGMYELGGGVINAGTSIVGYGGAGTFNQGGGDHNVTNEFNVALEAGSTGTYNLTTGTVNCNYMFVGYHGAGTFNQDGGAVNITGGGHLGVGREEGSVGEYNLRGGAFNTTDLYVGWQGAGTFNQAGGVINMTGDLNLAEQNSGRATYNLQVGDLAAATLHVGMHGIATFNQSAGTSLTLNNDLFVVSQSAAGTSTFNQHGGTTTVAGHLGLGRDQNSHGTYNLENGALNLNELYIGYEGAGIFNQTGGTNNVAANIFMGDFHANATGAYNLSHGTLTAGFLGVGNLGAGAFNQSGDSTATITTDLNLNRGTYNLSQNATLTADSLFVGNQGAGAFNQSGASIATINDDLNLDRGAYNLAGGTLNAATINLNLNGVFNQTGGTLNFTTFNHQGGEVQGSLQNPVGGAYNYDSGAFTGRLLNSGAANFNADFTAGNGMAHFSALTLNAGRSLTFNGQGLTVDQGGLFTQTGGTLTAVSETIGDTGIGVFTQEGGAHNVTNILTLAATGGSAGTYNLNNGTLSAGTINLNTGGIFNRNGGTLNFTTLNLPGGAFQGDLDTFGTITGSGLIQGNYTNRGTVNPGNSAGTLHVAGSYTQAPTGNYVLEIESATNYDKIVVTGAPGAAVVGGTLTPTLLGGYTPPPNQLFQGIVTATGGVTGQFTTIASALPWKLLYYADRIDLLMEMLAPAAPLNPRVAFDYADPGFPLSGNQRQIGIAFNAVKESASGDLGSVLDVIRQLPGPSVANAYQQISPDKAGAMPNLSLAASMMQWRNLTNRMSYLRWGYGGRQTFTRGGGSGNVNFSYSRLSGLMLAYNGADLSSLLSGKRQEPYDGRRWGVYTDFVGTVGNQDSAVNQTGYDFNVFGFNSGIDYRLRDNLIIGLGSGYYHTAANFKGSGGSSEVNSIPFFAYGIYYPNSFYAMGSIGYTLNLYGLNRNLTFGALNRVADSSVTGSQFSVSGEMGYDLSLNGLILTPATSLYYSKAWIGGYTEKGADSLNLKVSSQEADSFQTGVGVRVARPFKVKNTQVVPQASAFYQHEFANNSRGLNARLPQTGGTLSYDTASPRRDFAVLGAGVAVGLKKNLYLQTNYNAEVGRGNSSAHFVSAGLRWEF